MVIYDFDNSENNQTLQYGHLYIESFLWLEISHSKQSQPPKMINSMIIIKGETPKIRNMCMR